MFHVPVKPGCHNTLLSSLVCVAEVWHPRKEAGWHTWLFSPGVPLASWCSPGSSFHSGIRSLGCVWGLEGGEGQTRGLSLLARLFTEGLSGGECGARACTSSVSGPHLPGGHPPRHAQRWCSKGSPSALRGGKGKTEACHLLRKDSCSQVSSRMVFTLGRGRMAWLYCIG